MNNTKHGRKYTNRLTAMALILFLLVFPSIGRAATPKTPSETEYLEELVEEYFYYDIPDEFYEIADPAGKINSLHDPYSQYFSAEEYEEFTQGIDMDFRGIGIYAEQVDEGIRITLIIEGSGASEAGLQEGDIITAADGVTLKGLTQEEAVSQIRGEEGTTAKLRIKRGDSDFQVSVKRGPIHVSTVEGSMLDNHVAYIVIRSFGEDTNAEFSNLLETFKAQDPVGYILDVRTNPGGYLMSAVDLVGYFAAGKPALSVRNKYGETTVFDATDHKVRIDKTMVLLTDRYSASASEIYAGAFRDYNAGLIVGEKTYGKGTVQSMFLLPGGGVAKLTVDQFFSPTGKVIHKVGVTPDLTVSELDPVRLAALLFGKPDDSSKRGYMQFTYNGHNCDIDLTEARKSENWGIYVQMINLYRNGRADLKKGSFSRWQAIPQGDVSKLWKYYYPEYKELPTLENVPRDKQFTITFNGTVTQSFLDSNPVELIHSKTGKRIPLSLQEQGANVYKAVPNEPLTGGENYYLVIHTGLASGSRNYGSIVEISAMK